MTVKLDVPPNVSAAHPWMQPAPLPSGLAHRPVRAWVARVEQAMEHRSELRRLLSHDEQERARRFLADRPREVFIASRGLVRIVLSALTGVPAECIQFVYAPNGKPSLASTSRERLFFNVAHSGAFALLGISADVEIGVDLEVIREGRDIPGLADRFFSRAESQLITSLSGPVQTEAFYRIWARKEAVLKANGCGITSGLREPDLSDGGLGPPCDAGLRVCLAGRTYTVYDLDAAPGCAAALALSVA